MCVRACERAWKKPVETQTMPDLKPPKEEGYCDSPVETNFEARSILLVGIESNVFN